LLQCAGPLGHCSKGRWRRWTAPPVAARPPPMYRPHATNQRVRESRCTSTSLHAGVSDAGHSAAHPRPGPHSAAMCAQLRNHALHATWQPWQNCVPADTMSCPEGALSAGPARLESVSGSHTTLRTLTMISAAHCPTRSQALPVNVTAPRHRPPGEPPRALHRWRGTSTRPEQRQQQQAQSRYRQQQQQ
jgi:hypothetical protein